MSRGSFPGQGRRRDDSGDNGFAEVVNSFTFDSGRKRRKRRAREEEVEETAGEQHAEPRYDESPPPDLIAESAVEEAPAASSIRSYTWTGGRTRSNYQLELETLVSTSEVYRPGVAVRLEHQSIAELCQHPRSVAEVGALLSVPIGVARVLLADMAELGLITVHQTVSESGSAPHLMLMERVLSGLRRL